MTVDAPQRAARAGLWLAALLVVPPLLPDASRDLACLVPLEAEAHDGHSVAVRCGGTGGAEGAALRGPARLLFGQGLDPNRADRRSLEALPGVGPALAAAIERERCRRAFTVPADLERVRGIGPRTRARLEPFVSVGRGEVRCELTGLDPEEML